MTKEKLKKEAEKYVKQNYCEMCVLADDCKSGCVDCFTVRAYVASAEPREKRIAELEAQNKNLQEMLQATRETRVNADYLKKITNLEAQIEQLVYLHNEDVSTIRLLNERIREMKCCENCAFQLVIGGVRDNHCVKCNACSEWKLED